MTNKRNGTIYTGVTSNLRNRVLQHKNNEGGIFTKKYKTHMLVYFEQAETMEVALAREKQLKGGSRKIKIDLIQDMNPGWSDLSVDLW